MCYNIVTPIRKGVVILNSFTQISKALRYIDEHLCEQLRIETLSERFFFSPFYFHRLFSAVVGRSFAAYVRDRRILFACKQLCETDKPVREISSSCGFGSVQAFSRTFRRVTGFSPSEYRQGQHSPVIETAEELIMKFTNRLQGGVFVVPNIISRGRLIIAGISGDGSKTGEVWQEFMKLYEENPPSCLSGDSYEIRVYDVCNCSVHVGVAVKSREDAAPGYTFFELPASKYASFDVYVSQGYDSENEAMDRWLETNEKGYSQRQLEGKNYCVEFYDERFNDDEAGSVVEIWVPVEKK